MKGDFELFEAPRRAFWGGLAVAVLGLALGGCAHRAGGHPTIAALDSPIARSIRLAEVRKAIQEKRPSGLCGELYYGIGMVAEPASAFECYKYEEASYRDPVHLASPATMRAYLLAAGCGVTRDPVQAAAQLELAEREDPKQALTEPYAATRGMIEGRSKAAGCNKRALFKCCFSDGELEAPIWYAMFIEDLEQRESISGKVFLICSKFSGKDNWTKCSEEIEKPWSRLQETLESFSHNLLPMKEPVDGGYRTLITRAAVERAWRTQMEKPLDGRLEKGGLGALKSEVARQWQLGAKELRLKDADEPDAIVYSQESSERFFLAYWTDFIDAAATLEKAMRGACADGPKSAVGSGAPCALEGLGTRIAIESMRETVRGIVEMTP